MDLSISACEHCNGTIVKGNIPLTIDIKYHSDITPIEEIAVGNWIDLRTAEDISLSTGDFAIISLGVSMKLPVGFEAILAPRSSTFKNYGILQTNSIGVIDNSYQGDNDIWGMPVYATRDIVIPKNTRIAQFRIRPAMSHEYSIQIRTVDTLTGEDRGGFGSTGKV